MTINLLRNTKKNTKMRQNIKLNLLLLPGNKVLLRSKVGKIQRLLKRAELKRS